MHNGDRVTALRREHAELIRFCRELDDDQWGAPSKAAGWRVQDAIAHMGSVCRSPFTPASLKLLRNNGSRDDAAVHISGFAAEFPEWGTKRADWRSKHVSVNGDVEYGTWFLDSLNVV